MGSTGRALKVPFSRPLFTGDEAAALAEVIASRWVTQGPAVAECERELKNLRQDELLSKRFGTEPPNQRGGAHLDRGFRRA